MRFIILDIRTYDEYCSGHLCGALLIETEKPPLTNYQLLNLYNRLKSRMNKFDKNIKVFLYCKKGIRANIAKKMLIDLGYLNVEVLGGVDIEPLKKYIQKNACYCQKNETSFQFK